MNTVSRWRTSTKGFFAVQAAAKAYDPEKGSFATLLGYYVQAQMNKAVRGEHSRIVTTEDGKQVRLSANPLNTCTSLTPRLTTTTAAARPLAIFRKTLQPRRRSRLPRMSCTPKSCTPRWKKL